VSVMREVSQAVGMWGQWHIGGLNACDGGSSAIRLEPCVVSSE
jgi:hypothetical protein